ncbi:MAG: hypothetical protein WBN89_13580 [Prochlorococcaceae cyanobacterium]
MALAINSDNPEATRTLAAIAAICRSHGARWHPQLQARIQKGQMSLWAPEGVSGSLISMPTALLVPIDGARWGRNPHQLQLLAAPPQLTRVQSELLLLQIGLYNATGKLRWWSERHPARLLDRHPELAEAVAQLKPGYGSPRKERQEGRCAAERFLDTRSYCHQPDAKSGETSGQTINVLLPLIDLLNHHEEGAGLQIQGTAMVIEPGQPEGCGGECFASYGNRRDALDLALHYGFSDTSTPFAHGAALQLNMDVLGRLRVKGQLFGRPDHPLDPPVVNQSEGEISISHLCCDRSQPQRLLAVLDLALRAELQRQGQPRQQAAALSQAAIEAIARTNQERLAHLISTAESLLPSHPEAAILSDAARHQAAVMAAVLGT